MWIANNINNATEKFYIFQLNDMTSISISFKANFDLKDGKIWEVYVHIGSRYSFNYKLYGQWDESYFFKDLEKRLTTEEKYKLIIFNIIF